MPASPKNSPGVSPAAHHTTRPGCLIRMVVLGAITPYLLRELSVVGGIENLVSIEQDVGIPRQPVTETETSLAARQGLFHRTGRGLDGEFCFLPVDFIPESLISPQARVSPRPARRDTMRS